MRKEMKNKLMPILLMLSLLLSAVAIIPQVSADPFVFPDGLVSKTTGLTCGEPIVYQVKDGSLTPETDYVLQIDAASGWIDLEGEESDEDGDLIINFEAPGWGNLDEDPIGTWDLRLWDDDASAVEAGYEAQIDIENLYEVRIKYGGDWLDNLIYNTSYAPIYIYAYNWTGSKYEECDFDLDFDLDEPDATDIAEALAIPDGIWDLDIDSDSLNLYNGDGTMNLEYYCPLYIDDGTHTTTQAIPILLDFTADVPDDAEWGDTISVSGYVRDGQDNGIGGYDVRLYSPTNGSYVEAATATTYSTGRYYMSVDTGIDDDFSAGVWYIGTYNDITTYPERVDENDIYEHLIDGSDFIRYSMFEVASDDSAEVKIEDPDELRDGFNQTINVSAEWDNEPFQADDEDALNSSAAIHITGVDGYDWDAGVEFDEDDYYFVGWTSYDSSEDESTCEFDNFQFNETGTLTVYLTWPYYGDIYFENEYNNTDYFPNVTGSVDIGVGSADEMNMVVENIPDEVMIDETCGWMNTSDLDDMNVTISLYGDTSADKMNASLEISGCGLDITIDEDDEVADSEYLLAKSEGIYNVKISPKTGGVITITATNETEELSVTKDFKVSGLTGSVTTSDNDDKEISVESSETIKVTVNQGAYATVKIGYYDEDWATPVGDFDCDWDDITGDGETPGEGLDGIFEFEVSDEDIEDGVGYMVVVAGTAELYMYEIIEIAPVHDLTIELIEPTNASGKDLTVGIDHDDWEFKVYGPGGDVMGDIDGFWGKLVDEDNDEDNPLQTIMFKERSGNKWVPDDDLLPWFDGQMIFTAVNNSGENEHDGNITFNVDCATVTYMPEEVTAGIDLENFTVEILVVDANDEPVPEGTKLFLHIENATGNMELDADEREVTLDEDGMGEFEIECVGDNKTWINGTLGDNDNCCPWDLDWEDGNESCGQFDIDWPNFLVQPDTIYIGQANTVNIIATDYMGDPIEGINLTLFRSYGWDTPDPVETDEDGKAEFSIEPENSGEANVTIARGIEYVDGVLNWDVPPDGDSVVTDTIVKITSLKTLQISISKSPIWEEETLTITIKSDDVAVEDVDVEFAELTKKTDDNGMVTFTVPDPGVDSAIYTVTAEKDGYRDEDKTITVIKIWEVTILGPKQIPSPGEQFTITILAKGSPLAGATVTFDGETYASGGDGKMTLTAPDVDTETDFTITATFEAYQDGTLTITIKPGGIPGFELVTLIAALGVAFILLRRRR